MTLPKADLVLAGGRIFLGARAGFADALALWRGRVLAAGREGDLEGLAGPATRRLDLRGRAAVPGFFDAHQHTLWLGLEAAQVDLGAPAVATIDDLLSAVAARAAATPPGEWVLGRRYDDLRLAERRHPTREELDRVAPRNPVFLSRVCTHMGVANSAALAAAGVTAETPDPEGGRIEREAGRLTGLLQERARDLVLRAIPVPDDLAAAAALGTRLCAERGITSVMDAAVGARAGLAEWQAYVRALRAGRLAARVTVALTGGPGGVLERAHAAGLVTGVGDARLRVGPVKLFTDGSASGRTAAMSEPYRPGGGHGILYYRQEELDAVAADAHAKGYQLAVHAIGDVAVEQTLTAFERALAREGGPAGGAREGSLRGPRPRVEHCGFLRPGDLERLARLGAVPVPQPVFLYHFGDGYVETLGPERPHGCYPMASFLRGGLKAAASSDAPVSDLSPLVNLYAMVTRRSHRGALFGPGERVGLEAAVTALTEHGAFACFAEGERGTLEPGMLADVAVLSEDVFDAPPERLLEARVDLTLLGGEVTHDRTGEAGGR
jgi:predicted amidohydrolase YtcJ